MRRGSAVAHGTRTVQQLGAQVAGARVDRDRGRHSPVFGPLPGFNHTVRQADYGISRRDPDSDHDNLGLAQISLAHNPSARFQLWRPTLTGFAKRE